MKYQRILTIQDISCIGQCSMTVALPILSACGIETAVLPSAVLSTHTGGFKGYTFRDLTDDMPAIAQHWKTEKLRFSAVYTGYLGSQRQINYVKEIVASLCKPEGLLIVDPAMADNGKLYVGFDDDFVAEMKTLCAEADYLLPNITEACLLTGIPYREIYDHAYIEALLSALAFHPQQTLILTGVSFDSASTGVMIYRNGTSEYYCHRKISAGCHGTGDVYASAFTGALLHGKTPCEAAKIAADFTVRCIEYTNDDPTHWYGVKFEPILPELIRAL